MTCGKVLHGRAMRGMLLLCKQLMTFVVRQLPRVSVVQGGC